MTLSPTNFPPPPFLHTEARGQSFFCFFFPMMPTRRPWPNALDRHPPITRGARPFGDGCCSAAEVALVAMACGYWASGVGTSVLGPR